MRQVVQVLAYIPKQIQELAFGMKRKLSRFNDRKDPNINNMGVFSIVESRGFGSFQTQFLSLFGYGKERGICPSSLGV